MNTNGFILYEGPSLFDGEPIVVIITGYETPTSNRKTGDMVQSWIIKQGEYPNEAISNNTDSSICGNCPLKGKVCYVMMMPVNNIYRNYKEGRYPHINNQILRKIKRRHRLIRIGSYGDPCASPIESWVPLIDACDGYTGYTHAWFYSNPLWKKYLMASVETIELMNRANSLGWRTYRVTNNLSDVTNREVVCTNYLDNDILCEDCQLCNGYNKKPNIVNLIHGASWKVNNYKELVEV